MIHKECLRFWPVTCWLQDAQWSDYQYSGRILEYIYYNKKGSIWDCKIDDIAYKYITYTINNLDYILWFIVYESYLMSIVHIF